MQILCDLSFLRRRVAAGMLDIHIDDCYRALRHFASVAHRYEKEGGSLEQNEARGYQDPEWHSRLDKLRGRLQEMTDFLVADRALMLQMPALVAQQAANQPVGSAPEIAGLFALDRGVAGQERSGAQSLRAHAAEEENREIRVALARYRPPSESSLGLGGKSSKITPVAVEPGNQTNLEYAIPDSEQKEDSRKEDTLTDPSHKSTMIAADYSTKTSTALGLQIAASEVMEPSQSIPPDHATGVVTGQSSSFTGISITNFKEESSNHSVSDLAHPETALKPQDDTRRNAEHSAPRPQAWIEHVNKEARAAAALKRQRISGVAWNGAVAGQLRTAFAHVALSPDEVLLTFMTYSIISVFIIHHNNTAAHFLLCQVEGCGVALICVSGGDGRARLYDSTPDSMDRNAGEEMCQLAGHSDALNWSAFSTACDLIATASDDCSIRVWRPPKYDSINRVLESPAVCLHIFRGRSVSVGEGTAESKSIGHEAAVTAVEFSPDGSVLVSASADRTLRTWDPRRGQLLRVLSGHGAGILCVSCSPAAATAASGCEDGGIRIWDIGLDAGKLDRPEGWRGKQLSEVK